MENNFVINVIWKEEKIITIDDKNLSKKESEKFYFNSEKSKEQKYVFSKKSVKEEIKNKLKYLFYAISLSIFAIILIYIGESAGINGEIAINISSSFLLLLGFMILGAIYIAISSPFYTYKNIIFEIDEFGQERIRKQNVIGIISTIVNIKYIKEVKLIKDSVNSYFLIAEESDDKISENSIVLMVESKNKNQIFETEKMLKVFINDEILVSELISK
jgi:hypothetical protein